MECSSSTIAQNNSISVDDPTVIQSTIKKRSSIFKPRETGITINYNLTQGNKTESSNMTYSENLQKEILTWKNCYSTLKKEYNVVKNSSFDQIGCTDDVKEFLDQADVVFENFLTSSDDFIMHVNNTLKMHDHLVHYYNLRVKQMNCLKTNLPKEIQKKFNL